MVLPALREENLAKIEEENDKKNRSAALPSWREKKSWKTFWKGCFETVKELFLKNLKYDVRLIEKQVWSIKPGRGSQNF